MQREIILITGQTGSGKTTKAREIISQFPRVFVLDAGFGEYGFQEYGDFETMVRDLETRGCFHRAIPFRASFTPLEHDIPDCFELAKSLGPCLLVLEEADRFTETPLSLEYSDLINRGRHYGVSMLAVSLHPYDLPKDLRRQCTVAYCGRAIEPNDLTYLAEIIGDQAYSLPELPNFKFLEWQRNETKPLTTPPPSVKLNP